jgi:large subunit ribosomal protein L29
MPKELKTNEIRTWSEAERDKKLIDLRHELLTLRSIHTGGGVRDNPSRPKQIKRSIARILTVMKENEIKS